MLLGLDSVVVALSPRYEWGWSRDGPKVPRFASRACLRAVRGCCNTPDASRDAQAMRPFGHVHGPRVTELIEKLLLPRRASFAALNHVRGSIVDVTLTD